MTPFEGNTAVTLLDGGQNASLPNFVTESLFYTIWSSPNFHGDSIRPSGVQQYINLCTDKESDLPLLFWPVYGFAYDVLIGGLYPNQLPEWDYNLHGKTLELACPVTQANALLKRVRQLFDQAAAEGKPVTSTYRR